MKQKTRKQKKQRKTIKKRYNKRRKTIKKKYLKRGGASTSAIVNVRHRIENPTQQSFNTTMQTYNDNTKMQLIYLNIVYGNLLSKGELEKRGDPVYLKVRIPHNNGVKHLGKREWLPFGGRNFQLYKILSSEQSDRYSSSPIPIYDNNILFILKSTDYTIPITCLLYTSPSPRD